MSARPRLLAHATVVAALGACAVALSARDVSAVGPRAKCAQLTRGGVFKNYVAGRDLHGTVKGDDPFAIVNRTPTGALPDDYAPSDLVAVSTLKPMGAVDCDKVTCLRREAAEALARMRDAMKTDKHTLVVESAFRGYDVQCTVFQQWASIKGFCEAAQDSALPGHSQHQLGTAADLFTDAWVRDARGAYRRGFGCSTGGVWLRENAWKFGFVLAYPPVDGDDACPPPDRDTKPNPKTGYRYEPWHFRFLPQATADAFHAAQQKAPKLTLEQFLRRKQGLPDDPEPAVCDGCACDACSTLDAAASPCASKP